MKIGLEHVGDFARGAAILGTGGGGDPYLGSLMLRQAIRDHGPVDLIDVEQLGDDDFVVPFAMMGAPTVLVEKLPNGAEMVAALRAMERYRGERARAILCAEIGGINALLPLVLAARCGLPVVDGDGIGRAFPQLPHDSNSDDPGRRRRKACPHDDIRLLARYHVSILDRPERSSATARLVRMPTCSGLRSKAARYFSSAPRRSPAFSSSVP